jgi:hypothetical protein
VTVALAVKVFDGIVLATDSATTFGLQDGDHQVYNSADKIFQLHRRRPVGAMTWGLGAIGAASISTLAKDLRTRFMGKDPLRPDWALDDGYTIEGVAIRLIEMMYDLFDSTYGSLPPDPNLGLGFLVAGYSDGSASPEAWKVIIDNSGTVPVPELEAGADGTGYLVYAQPQAVLRLFTGIDPSLREAVVMGAPEEVRPDLETLINSATIYPAPPPMPLADAVALAKFLVDVTIGFRRFTPGADTVGGPVEVAAISRHERFKWISRKHYYPADLNPEDPHT